MVDNFSQNISLFETILCKPERWLCVIIKKRKFPVDQQQFEILLPMVPWREARPPHGNTWSRGWRPF